MHGTSGPYLQMHACNHYRWFSRHIWYVTKEFDRESSYYFVAEMKYTGLISVLEVTKKYKERKKGFDTFLSEG